MKNPVTHICSIQNHPIRRIKESDRLIYLSGLGAFLHSITQKEEVSFLFNAWCYSILGYYKEDYGLFNANGTKYIKKAIRIENTWWSFYSVNYTFFFDCFYLLYCQSEISAETVYILLKSYCKWNIFHKRKLESFYNALIHNSISRIKNLDVSFLSRLNMDKHCQEIPYKKILVVANVSAGKSMLINAIAGRRICKSTNRACTSKLHYIYNKQYQDFPVCQTAKHIHILDDSRVIDDYSYDSIGLNFNSKLLKNKVCFIDTPGVNNSENSKHEEITKQVIQNGNYDALIYVSNCQYFGTNDENKLLQTIIKHSRKPILFVLNQLDRFKSKEDSVDKMLQDYHNDLVKLGVKKPVIIPVSAYAALLMKLECGGLEEEETEELAVFRKRFSKDYFNLPSYIMKKKSSSIKGLETSLIDRTGIPLLEETIIKTIIS